MVTLSVGWLAVGLSVVLGAAGCSELCGGALLLFGAHAVRQSRVGDEPPADADPAATADRGRA